MWQSLSISSRISLYIISPTQMRSESSKWKSPWFPIQFGFISRQSSVKKTAYVENFCWKTGGMHRRPAEKTPTPLQHHWMSLGLLVHLCVLKSKWKYKFSDNQKMCQMADKVMRWIMKHPPVDYKIIHRLA